MDSIPFEFCDAVVGTIKDLPRVDVPFPDAKWNCALQDHSANRQCCLLHVAFSDRKWSYRLFNARFGSKGPLTTVLQQVGSKYLRIDEIQCAWHVWIVTETSKEDDLHMLLNRLKPFLNFPKLSLYDSKIPKSDLDQLFSLFAKINISVFYSTCSKPSVTEFAKKLMQEDTLLKRITIRNAEDVLADEIKDYRATGRVVHVETECYFSDYETSLRFVR